jgi:uncharacterized membrane protein (UPF0127 family)
MFSRPVVISMIIAIALIIFSELLIFWIAKKSNMVDMHTVNPWKNKVPRKKRSKVICRYCGAKKPA